MGKKGVSLVCTAGVLAFILVAVNQLEMAWL